MSLALDEMLAMQQALQKRYEGIWEGDSPATAKNHLLYAVEEVGEVAAILKKRGAEAVRDDENVRAAFCEEMSDVLMYLMDTVLCCGVSAEQLEAAYRAKAQRNLTRDFVGEHESFLKP